MTVVESDDANIWILGVLKSFDPEFEKNNKTVFTDGACSDACIAKVLPNSKHLICTFHFTKFDIPKKLRGHLRGQFTTFAAFVSDKLVAEPNEFKFNEAWQQLSLDYQNDPIVMKYMTDKVSIKGSWALFSRILHLTLGKKGSTTSEQSNSAFAAWMNGENFILPDLFQRCMDKEIQNSKEEQCAFNKQLVSNPVNLYTTDTPSMRVARKSFSDFILDKFEEQRLEAAHYACKELPATEDFPNLVGEVFRIGRIDSKRRIVKVQDETDPNITRFCCYPVCSIPLQFRTFCRHNIAWLLKNELDPLTLAASYIDKRWKRRFAVGRICTPDPMGTQNVPVNIPVVPVGLGQAVAGMMNDDDHDVQDGSAEMHEADAGAGMMHEDNHDFQDDCAEMNNADADFSDSVVGGGLNATNESGLRAASYTPLSASRPSITATTAVAVHVKKMITYSMCNEICKGLMDQCLKRSLLPEAYSVFKYMCTEVIAGRDPFTAIIKNLGGSAENIDASAVFASMSSGTQVEQSFGNVYPLPVPSSAVGAPRKIRIANGGDTTSATKAAAAKAAAAKAAAAKTTTKSPAVQMDLASYNIDSLPANVSQIAVTTPISRDTRTPTCSYCGDQTQRVLTCKVLMAIGDMPHTPM